MTSSFTTYLTERTTLALASVALAALASVLPAAQVAGADTASDTGALSGSVVRCGADAETPAVDVLVVVVGTSLGTHTDVRGDFLLRGVPASQIYTVAALTGDAGTPQAERFNVPVVPGGVLDIGTLELGGSPVWGCAQDAGTLEAGFAPGTN